MYNNNNNNNNNAINFVRLFFLHVPPTKETARYIKTGWGYKDHLGICRDWPYQPHPTDLMIV
jgi:hypothetical protein